MYHGIYERLLTKALYNRGLQFSDVVENRSGVIAVLQEKTGPGQTTSTATSRHTAMG